MPTGSAARAYPKVDGASAEGWTERLCCNVLGLTLARYDRCRMEEDAGRLWFKVRAF